MRKIIGVVITAAAGLTIGCGGSDDVCKAASEHIGACLGDQAAPPWGTCDFARAEQLLAQDCAGVRSAIAAGKADGWGSDFMCELGYYSYCEPFSEPTGMMQMRGDWRLVEGDTESWRPYGLFGCPPQMRVQGVTDPSWEITITLRTIPEGDEPGKPIYERADFIHINGEELCDSGDVSATEALEVCHRTRVIGYGQVEHRVRFRSMAGIGSFKPVPTGSNSSYQRLIVVDDQLTYEYENEDSEPPLRRCVFAKL